MRFHIKKERDYYVRALRYAEKHPEGFTLPALREYLGLKEKEFKALGLTEVDGVFRYYGYGEEGGKIAVYVLSFDARFKLLQHDELEQARRFSWAAVIFAVLTLVVSISIGVFSLGKTQEQLDLTRSSLEFSQQQIRLAMEPQIDIYLRHGGGDPEDIILGIMNIGAFAISDLTGETWVAGINSQGCSGSTGLSQTLWFGEDARLGPKEKQEFSVASSGSGIDSHLYVLQLSYKDEDTGQYFARQEKFLERKGYLYREENIPKTEDMARLEKCAEIVKIGTLFREGDVVHSSMGK